ncbi:unnamed protein product (macronuclear) [Paramecium tetraurelia]|uniref:Uncharacterized protein n=1 Tax=Paramecium tetraurelia TaxID=5888 RepID=A0EGL3_PARTE|nr:uncharacterized protein GSPATT00026778001 [Paramecium tetraurelia]CAK94454.1 unnamed protein product [Paramecium tetraurelia]|eukprot:XP_001461827.1 hypothetical protein (macronuclear) [Paramecium tetraurelia strain d4-2]
MKSQCYLHGYPLECQNQLQDLFNKIREGEEFITLERIFKLLRTWQYDVPFSNLCKLLRKSNQACHQNAKNHLNEQAFHQLLHNPDIQMIYKPKKDETVNTPPTLDGLFKRIGEQIERKRLQEKMNDENITNKENCCKQGSPRNDRESSVVIEKVKSVRKFKDEEFKLFIKPKKPKRKGESIQEPHQVNAEAKFTKLPNATLHFPTSRIRKLHDHMMQQMDEIRMDPNVQKLSNIIHKSQGNLSIRLPQIQYI